MRNMIGSSSQRNVARLDLIVKMELIGGAGDVYDITVRIGNDVAANSDPVAPAVDAGPDNGINGIEYSFESSTTDPEADELYYQWEFDDGSKVSAWYGPYASGEVCSIGHTFEEGDYDVQVRAKDGFGAETEWSTAHAVHIQCCAVRGNVDNDSGGEVDISDLVALVDYMFTGGLVPACPEAANIDGSCCGDDGLPGTTDDIDISDLVALVDYMFTGGPAPPTCTP